MTEGTGGRGKGEGQKQRGKKEGRGKEIERNCTEEAAEASRIGVGWPSCHLGFCMGFLSNEQVKGPGRRQRRRGATGEGSAFGLRWVELDMGPGGSTRRKIRTVWQPGWY